MVEKGGGAWGGMTEAGDAKTTSRPSQRILAHRSTFESHGPSSHSNLPLVTPCVLQTNPFSCGLVASARFLNQASCATFILRRGRLLVLLLLEFYSKSFVYTIGLLVDFHIPGFSCTPIPFSSSKLNPSQSTRSPLFEPSPHRTHAN